MRWAPDVAEEGREADVYVRLGGADVLAGRLWSRRRGNAESQTFAYDNAYPRIEGAYELFGKRQDGCLKVVLTP